VLALPLAGMLVLALSGSREPARAFSRLLGVAPTAIGFALSAVVFATLLGRDAEERAETSRLWRWIELGDLRVDVAVLVDPLSVLMMLIITGVGALILLYSTEYMEHDRDYRRFFAQMNFFVFAMLLLVLAANFIFLIVGWGLVGLASYLLIGYYYDRPSAVRASKKAFVINVIGDVGLVIAAFLIAQEFGTLDYDGVFATAPDRLGAGSLTAELIALLILVGAAAKSGQVPLHSWLPDAMEGPTPVSALIHAATMVTAGVYLIVRCNVLYQLAPHASDVVAVVGGVTLLMAATIATVQSDIKRVLAWSTVSQIGYMIMAAGLGLYSAAMFHLLTHAFFKALLFLTAGIVIHALYGEQLIDRMGGLARYLRGATVLMLIGCLAISGVPPFSGFWSKDEIIARAWEAGTLGVVLGIVALLAAGLTAFYMFRMFFRVFLGPEPQGGYARAPHGAGRLMTLPVAVLGVLAVVGGLIQIPHVWHLLDDWLEPALLADPHIEASGTGELLTLLGSVLVAGLGIAVAWYLFGAEAGRRRTRLAGALPRLRGVLEEQYRFDEVYEEAVVQPGRDLGDAALRGFEPAGADGIVRTGAALSAAGAAVVRRAQNGLVRSYAFALVAGTVIVAAVFILQRG
ncbi:MAG TPA: NADH-quinone oxidoreductase subunit L, partial [Miltoncostaeaceae bacterium]|nr:NADH-quinone oxidoreductase subunit L [Miltoncostaeaceae bacterium]